jgi:hypothetical protein
MATAFASLTRLFASFRALLACFARPVSAGTPPVRAAQQAPAGHAFKPLRVVRVLEPSAPRSTAGRMVISGRLADVCAELDRLAAMEAQGC